jgi:hypothetical protein
MLPNVRLMIAATFTSVVVLIFGFGVFAALRVSHQPLERSASAAPLLLIAANAATSVANVAAAEPFERRFQIDEPAGGGGISALAYSAPEQPAERSAVTIVVPAADYHDATLSEPGPTPMPPDSVDASAPSQPATAAGAVPEAKPDEIAAATGALAPPSALSVAVALPNAESMPEQTHPAAPAIETEVPPPPSITEPAPTMPETAAKSAEKEAKRPHVATRTHHARKARAIAQDAAFEQPRSEAAQAWPSQAAQQPAKSRHAKNTSSTTAVSSPATGGPSISAPSR